MGRRRLPQLEDEVPEEVEVVMRWSKNRIFIATSIVVILILLGLYAIFLISENKQPSVLGVEADKPKIKIPDEKNIEEVIENAKKDLSNINTDNIIQSQPKLQKIINDLTNITNASVSAKSLICDAVCK